MKEKMDKFDFPRIYVHEKTPVREERQAREKKREREYLFHI